MMKFHRREGETVTVVIDGKQVTFTVCKLRGSRIEIGIDAPPGVEVFRGELWSKIVAEREQAIAEALEADFPKRCHVVAICNDGREFRGRVADYSPKGNILIIGDDDRYCTFPPDRVRQVASGAS